MPDVDLYRERAEALATDEWLLGENPEFTTAIDLQTPEGILDLRVKVKSGRIADLVVYTDALSVSLPSDVCAALRGMPYDEEEILHTLEHIITRRAGVPCFSAQTPAATERRPS